MKVLIKNIKFNDDVVVSYKVFNEKVEANGTYKNPENYEPEELKEEIKKDFAELVNKL
ncbi:MAG: hypothetical protein K9K76_09170 [Halanaerobiales bacterium]|nr:hypothetical protein [Halanaerobiales bacterium]